MKNQQIALIIDAGIAGLTCAYKLITECENIKPIIVEKTMITEDLQL